jgi:hypothetical protein
VRIRDQQAEPDTYYNIINTDPNTPVKCVTQLQPSYDMSIRGKLPSSIHPQLEVTCSNHNGCGPIRLHFDGFCGEPVGVTAPDSQPPSLPALWPTTGECQNQSPRVTLPQNCRMSADCSQLRCGLTIEGTSASMNFGLCEDRVFFALETEDDNSGYAAQMTLLGPGRKGNVATVVDIPELQKGLLSGYNLVVRLVDTGLGFSEDNFNIIVNVDRCDPSGDGHRNGCEKLIELISLSTAAYRNPFYCTVPGTQPSQLLPVKSGACSQRSEIRDLPPNCQIAGDCSQLVCNMEIESQPIEVEIRPCAGGAHIVLSAFGADVWKTFIKQDSAKIVNLENVPKDGRLLEKNLAVRVAQSADYALAVNFDACAYETSQCEKLHGVVNLQRLPAYIVASCPQPHESSKGPPGLLIPIIAAVAGLVVLAIPITIAVVCYRRRRRAQVSFSPLINDENAS